jgi:hypothetical protein
LLPGINIKAFEKKLYEQEPLEGEGSHATAKLSVKV